MSVMEHRSARPSGPLARIGRAMVHALDWLDGTNNPYSPAVCVSTLLLVGLMVKLGPALHALY
jgi:hypothetical protein